MTQEESEGILRGTTTFEVYQYLLMVGRPAGIREAQRALNLSSPSVAKYHLDKIEKARLVKRVGSSYVVKGVFMQNSVRIGHFLIPKFFFYSLFAVSSLLAEFTVFVPDDLSFDYSFFSAVMSILTSVLCFETAKAWVKGNL